MHLQPQKPMIMGEGDLVEYINRSLDEEEEFHGIPLPAL